MQQGNHKLVDVSQKGKPVLCLDSSRAFGGKESSTLLADFKTFLEVKIDINQVVLTKVATRGL